MKRVFTLFASALLTLTAFAGGEFLVIGKTATPPVIDGDLNDPCWKNAVEITNFIKLNHPGTAAERATKVYATYDSQNLYIGIFCREEYLNPVFNKLHEFRANITTPDTAELWKDDIVEIFIAPDPNNATQYYHIAYNSRGTLYDSLGVDPKAWNSGAKVATKIVVKGDSSANDASGWSSEIAIPFAALKMTPPEAGTRWKVNFCRKATSINEVSSWTQTAGRFHDPSNFGTLEFGNTVPGISSVSSVATVTSGRNEFCAYSIDPVRVDIVATFPDDIVYFTKQGEREIRVPFTLDPDNKAYQFTAGEKDTTDTFLRSGNLNFTPDKTYTITLRAKTNYTANVKGYQFLTIVQKEGGYQPLPIRFPETTNQEWQTFTCQFTNKANSSGTLWGIKWERRDIKGTVLFDDISIIENDTGKNILDNGNFSGGSRNWNIFRSQSLVPGYGYGAASAGIRYLFKDQNGKLLYQSPEYKIKLSKENSQISSSIVQFGSNGLIPLEKFQICAGTMERMNLYLKSDCRNTATGAKITLTTPYGIRILPPEKQTTFPVPAEITEQIITRQGKQLRQYTLTASTDSINDPDTDFRVAAGIPVYFIADTPERGVIGTIEYQAELDPKRKEENPHSLKLEILDPPAGVAPSHELPLILWVYADARENKLMSSEQQNLIEQKTIDSGFNMIRANAEVAQQAAKLGIRSLPVLPPLTLSGPYFPYAAEFVKKNPEYAAVNAHGQKTQTLDPAVLLSADNPFKPYMEKVIARYLKSYPHELHVDYEFPFMPRQKGTLPRGTAINGFSQRNLGLFRKEYQIQEDVTPEIIFEKYAEQWRNFRNKQNADILGLYNKIAKEQNPKVRFSVYSGYPPQSDLYYGIDWKKLSPQIDLCMGGYGGNDALMLKEISQNFYNSGLLLMGYVDSTQMTNTLTQHLCNAGSYMCYLHFTSDGGFFRKASVTASLAAGFEPFLLDIRNNRNNSLTTDSKTGNIRGDVQTFQKDGEIVVILMNHNGTPAHFDLNTQEVSALDAIQFSSKKKISHKNGVYGITVAPYTADAVYFYRLSALPDPETPQVIARMKLEYPIFRWKAENPAVDSYEVRYASAESALKSAKVYSVVEPYYQIPEKLQSKVFCQVRTVSPNGKKSAWSTPTEANVLSSTLLSYRNDPEYLGSLQKSRLTQFFSWGGGSELARGSIDTQIVAVGDKASLRIDNEFDTTQSYWNMSRGNGCHFTMPEVRHGEKYYFEAKVRTKGNGRASIAVAALDSRGNIISVANSKSLSGDHEWTQLTVERTIPENAKYVNLFFSYAGEGSAWCSDLKSMKK